jgi:succinate dehydrogenase / fumarate reductase flavoprotein subunit
MSRNEAGLKEALKLIPQIRQDFWKNVKVLGENEEFNQSLEKAGRVADFLEFGELMCLDALERKESCGSHFRSEFQTQEGEAKRDDQNFCYVSAWEFQGAGKAPALHKESLNFEYIPLAQRSYK